MATSYNGSDVLTISDAIQWFGGAVTDATGDAGIKWNSANSLLEFVDSSETTQMEWDPATGILDSGEAWVEPTLLNSWENHGASNTEVAYRKDAFGQVHIRGGVKNGSSGTAVVFVLPVGYRPAISMQFPAISSAGTFTRCDISNGGNVIFNPGDTTYSSFGEIIFTPA